MLYPVAALSQDGFRKVGRRLGNEIHPDTFRADETDDLFNFVGQCLGGILEEHVGFVEEEHHLGEFHVTDFGHLVVDFGQEPHQEGGVELGLEHQLVSSQDIHHPPSSFSLDEVINIESRFAEETVATLFGQGQQGTLDGTYRSRGDVAVSGLVPFGILGHIVQHQPEVLHVNERKVFILGDAESQGQDTRLGFVQVHETGQEHSSHLFDGGPHRVPLFAEYIVETYRTAFELQCRGVHAPFGTSLLDELAQSSRLRDARKVALHVGHEARNTGLRERFRQDLQGNGLTGTCGTGYQSVPVGHLSYDVDRPFSRMGHIELLVFVHSG